MQVPTQQADSTRSPVAYPPFCAVLQRVYSRISPPLGRAPRPATPSLHTPPNSSHLLHLGLHLLHDILYMPTLPHGLPITSPISSTLRPTHFFGPRMYMSPPLIISHDIFHGSLLLILSSTLRRIYLYHSAGVSHSSPLAPTLSPLDLRSRRTSSAIYPASCIPPISPPPTPLHLRTQPLPPPPPSCFPTSPAVITSDIVLYVSPSLSRLSHISHRPSYAGFLAYDTAS